MGTAFPKKIPYKTVILKFGLKENYETGKAPGFSQGSIRG
jgi:hypothetical protein